MIGEANRLYKDNLSAVMVSKTGDANFASASACWDRLIVQYPVDPIHQPKLGRTRFGERRLQYSRKSQRRTRTQARRRCGT
jgi:hypothetical protein